MEAEVQAVDAEVLRQKSLAEHHYLRSDLKLALSHAKKALRLAPSLPGLPQLVAALRIICAPSLNPFRVLSLPYSSTLPSARRRHRSLSLFLRSSPSTLCSSDALERLNSALRLLSRTPSEPTLAQMQLLALRSRKKKPKEQEHVSTRSPAFRPPTGFRKGQVWAVYDDEDGMPRRYVLVDHVVSLNPFSLTASLLDPLSCQSAEKQGLPRPHVSCGRFKVGAKVDVESVNFFSHLVICERESRYVHRIHPEKGSVWVMHCEMADNSRGRRKRCFNVAVVLMGYSEMYGMSIAYLEKVDGFTAVFGRKEVGLHASKWLGKGDFQLFSHQVPARKITREEKSDLQRDCWELDPAALPTSLVVRRSGR